MNIVLLPSWFYVIAVFLQCPGDTTGQLTEAPPSCPGDNFTFTCTVGGNKNDITIWRVNGSMECPLAHTTKFGPAPCGNGDDFTVMTSTGFATNGTSFTSTLTGNVTSGLCGTLVECFGPAYSLNPENMVGNRTLQTVGPLINTFYCDDLCKGALETVNVTVNWTLSGGDNADFYLINITTNAPQTPYGGLLNITASVTQYELTGFMAGYEYNITVHGNCGGQEGSESKPLTIILQVPDAPADCSCIATYTQSSGELQSIVSTWNEVKNPMDPCSGISGNITQYSMQVHTQSSEDTEIVNISGCTAGWCSHSFVPHSNILNGNVPSAYDNVSVAARNVVGIGSTRNCTAQAISTVNHLLTGKVVHSSYDTTVNCTFLSGFTGSALCKVQYGTDPAYMNLPYSAESTETGTAGDTVSVVLRERLNSSTVYYYSISAVVGDLKIKVLAEPFTTPLYNCSTRDFWNLSAADTTFLSDVSLLNDSAAQYPSCNNDSIGSVVLMDNTLNNATVAYYTGVTPGSRACFVCSVSSGCEPNTAAVTERTCQNDGAWSESPITCVCPLRNCLQHIALIVIGSIFLFGLLITWIVVFFFINGPENRGEEQSCKKKKKIVMVFGVAILIFAVIFLIIGGSVVGSGNQHACDGLFATAFVISIVAIILSIIACVYLYCNKGALNLNQGYLRVQRGFPWVRLWLMIFAAVVQCSGDVSGQFIPAPPTCPNGSFIFECTIGRMNGITMWRVNGSEECILPHSTFSGPRACGSGSPFIAVSGTRFGTSATLFSSTLSGIATSRLDGTLVECFGPDFSRDAANMVGNNTLQIIGPPIVTISSHNVSKHTDGNNNVSLTWTLSNGYSTDYYLINITTNAPWTPYLGFLNITTSSVRQEELTGFMVGYEYNITVRGVTANCGGLVGEESEPLKVTLQAPEIPADCNCTATYNHMSGMLQSIYSTWNTVNNPVDPCSGISGNITHYKITYQTQSFVAAENVKTGSCTAGKCSHTFEPPSNLSSSYDSVSVSAENVVGAGAARTCTTQTISITNNLLTGGMVDVSSPSDVTVNCTFLSGFTGSAHCTVQYGTDPTYMNLPYSAESTETGTAGDSVSVVLRERLNSSTVYYYTVSAVSGDLTVVVLAKSFFTLQYNCSLMELWDLPATNATFLSNISLLNDTAAQYPSCDNESVGFAVLENTTLNTATVAYYNGTTTHSSACFVCDESSGYKLNTTIKERVCQGNVTWSGAPIVCVCTLPRQIGWHIALNVMSAIGLSISIAIICVTGIVTHRKRETLNSWTWYRFVFVYSMLVVITFFLVIMWMLLITNILQNENNCEWRYSSEVLIVWEFVWVLTNLVAQAMILAYILCQKTDDYSTTRESRTPITESEEVQDIKKKIE